MTFITLFRLLAANRRLANRRHPLADKNGAMKVLWGLLAALGILYLAVIGGMLGWMMRDAVRYGGYDIIDGGMLFFLAFDFLLRFAFFETPANEMKPYRLLPIGTRPLLVAYLLRIALSRFNFLWWAFLVPFGVLTVPTTFGWIGLLGWLVGWWLLFAANGLWYVLWRTLIARSWLWLLVPVALYAVFIWVGLFLAPSIRFMFIGCMVLGRGFCFGDVWAYAVPLVLMILLLWANVPLQYHCAYDEMAKEGSGTKTVGGRLGWLDRFGVYGEYIKLDLRSMMRNKVVRQQQVIALGLTLSLCVLNAFTDAYNANWYQHVIIFYCFALMGSGPLTQLLCPEGNYIDMLLSRRETVLTLLRAKYLLYCVLLVIPLLLLTVPVAGGKFTLFEALASLLFTAGIYYPVMFQCAVYNNRTLPLNEKLTRTQSSARSQLLISIAACLLPTLLIIVLYTVLASLWASVVLTVLGVAGIASNGWWLRGVYGRFMLRRYANMEGFRATRHAL